MPPTAAEVLERHGFGGDRLLKLARRIAADELRPRGGFLDHERMEVLVGYLAVRGIEASLSYDRDRHHARYGSNGGGDHFSSWLADILSHRVTDFYRRKSEGFGDRRYGLDGMVEFVGHKIEDDPDPDDAFEHELELQRAERRIDYDEAELAIAERFNLSPRARAGLHLIRLRDEGYKIAGKGTLTATRIAREEVASARA